MKPKKLTKRQIEIKKNLKEIQQLIAWFKEKRNDFVIQIKVFQSLEQQRMIDLNKEKVLIIDKAFSLIEKINIMHTDPTVHKIVTDPKFWMEIMSDNKKGKAN